MISLVKAGQITLREAASEIYAERECARSTYKRVLAEVSRWERVMDADHLRDISTSDLAEFRSRCLRLNLSPRTIETGVTAVLSILRQSGFTIERGRSIQWSPPPPKMPKLSDYSKVFAAADEYGRALLAVCYFTALRTSDLKRLHRDHIQDDCIQIKAFKTGKTHSFPLHPVLAHWLRPRLKVEFPVRKSPKRLRESLKRYCDAAGVQPFGPQQIRRLAANAYEMAHAGAGGYLLGHAINSRNATSYYLEGFSILKKAQISLAIPDAMLPKSKIIRREMEEKRLISAFRTLPVDERGAILSLISRGK